MRSRGVRRPFVACRTCGYETEVNFDAWPDDIAVPSFVPRLVQPEGYPVRTLLICAAFWRLRKEKLLAIGQFQNGFAPAKTL